MAHIVLIDDEPTVRGSLVQLLALIGHSVSAAASAKEGLALLRAQTVDLLLTDIEIPDGGLHTFEGLCLTFPKLPIVAMSGRSDWLARARAVGATRTIEKPFTLAQLQATIFEALTGSVQE